MKSVPSLTPSSPSLPLLSNCRRLLTPSTFPSSYFSSPALSCFESQLKSTAKLAEEQGKVKGIVVVACMWYSAIVVYFILGS